MSWNLIVASNRCPVVLYKLSKLLNQADASSAPCLRSDICSKHARAGSGLLWTRVGPSLLISQYRLRPPSHHADKRGCFPGGWRQMRG